MACQRVPEVNSSWRGDVVRMYKGVDVALYMHTEQGTDMPVLTDAHARGLSDIASASTELFAAAEKGELDQDPSVVRLMHCSIELSDVCSAGQTGTIAVCNVGMYGVRTFAPIVLPPHGAALGVGTITSQLVPSGECSSSWALYSDSHHLRSDDPSTPYKNVQRMNVTLSCDHRVIDGAVGAQWLAHFKSLLENPETMLL